MKVPDKIYLAKSLSFPDKIHRQWYKEDVVGNGIEYIRKDALLGWLEDMKFMANSERAGAYQNVIDKLNKM